MKVSIYTSAFNIKECSFDIVGAIENYSKIADEICIATLFDSKNDLLILNNLNNPKVKIATDENITKDTFAKDGKLKNLALQNCSNNICIQLDCDERIYNQEIWKLFIENNSPQILSGFPVMIPVIDLYKSKEYYCSINRKWYLHKKEGMYRGIVNFARLPNGKFDKEKSDGCELIDKDGNLFNSISFNFNNSEILKLMRDDQIPYVVHYGHLDLERRKRINEIFWNKEWESYSDKKNAEEVEKEYFKHGIII